MEKPFAGVVRATGVAQEDPRLAMMAVILGLLRAASRADPRTLPLLIANETAQAIPYDVGSVWDGARRRVAALSGSDTVDRGAPLAIWAGRCMSHMARLGRGGDGVATLLRADEITVLSPDLHREWTAVMPLHGHAMWMPFVDPRSSGRKPRLVGGMLLLREAAFTEWECEAASILGGEYAQAMLIAGIPLVFARRKKPGWGLPVMFLGCTLLLSGMLVQVREGVLSPAEVVAGQPRYLRSPQPGIVASLLVKPGDQVKAGQELAQLDSAELMAKREAARGAAMTADADLRQASQESVVDARARAKLPGLRAKIDEAAAELALATLRLDRAKLLSPVSGIAVFDDSAEIVGKPVEAGERIMLVAPSTSLRIEAHLPSSDDLPALVEGGEMLFHPNGSPFDSRRVVVDYVSHASSTAQDGTTSRIVRGQAAGEPLRLGTRGTARVYGAHRPFLLWALRKPIASVRQWLGL